MAKIKHEQGNDKLNFVTNWDLYAWGYTCTRSVYVYTKYTLKKKIKRRKRVRNRQMGRDENNELRKKQSPKCLKQRSWICIHSAFQLSLPDFKVNQIV